MKTSALSLAVLCALAVAAGAQTKPTPIKSRSGGYTPPPAGTSFLLVGGSDDCSTAATANAISGTGTFAVDTSVATSGAPIGSCGAMGNDVWFYWTATTTGTASVATCGGTGADTVIAVWADGAPAGSCPTTQIACNDDTCGLQSTVTFSATAGTSYFLELGGFAGATYTGTFTVSVVLPPVPPPNDGCATPLVINGAGVFPFDNQLATTGTEGQTEALCLAYSSTAIYKDSWWTWTPTLTGPVTVDTCNQVLGGTDTRIAVYDGAGCPVTPAIACNDDSCGLSSLVSFNAVCGQSYTIQIGNYSAAASLYGTFTVVESGVPCGPPATPICFGDGTGAACPCANSGAAGNGCANSVVAAGGNLTSSGFASVGGDTLVLVGSGMPNSSCLYFQGSAVLSGGLGTAFGDGLRCAGGTVIRLGTKTNVAGASQYPVAGDLPISVRGANAAGDFRVYQVWYRNAAAYCTPSTFNLTNAVSLTWAP